MSKKNAGLAQENWVLAQHNNISAQQFAMATAAAGKAQQRCAPAEKLCDKIRSDF
jgi:hypothetical protein